MAFHFVQEKVLHLSKSVNDVCPGGWIGFSCMAVASIVLLRYILHYSEVNKTKKRIEKRQAKAHDNIEKLRKRLESCRKFIDLDIIKLPFSELQAKLKDGQLTCRQVILAYQTKALELHDELNCVTGFISDAEERACKLDSLKPEERGMLHGIPISLKEVVGVAGDDTTSGLSFFIDKVHADYGNIMKVLIKHGAVPFVRTNISQGQVSISCSNPIFGESSNPVNPSRTCGGSSGGEGALLGGGGSILGVGCDMGGSIRIPCHFCGACGFKPTPDRISDDGNLPFGLGIKSLREVFGPMGRDVTSLVTFMKAALTPEMFQLDPLLACLPWREEIYNNRKPLKIGFYICDGGLQPVPAVQRAVLMARKALEKMGHKVVEFNPPDVVPAVAKFAVGSLVSDDGRLFGNVMKHDVVDPALKVILTSQSIPYQLRWVMSKIFFFLHPVQKSMISVKSCGNVYNWWKKNEERDAYRKKFSSQMKELGLDAILCPAFPLPAWPLRDDYHSLAGVTYTTLYNVLDFPCGAVPVTRVTDDDVKNMASYPKQYITDKYVHSISKGSENLPIAVQCVGYPFQEEVVLRVMKDLETGLHTN